MDDSVVSWNKKYSLSIERIDMEHKIFIDLIRNFQRESARDVDKERLSRLILEIEKYAEFHFVSEENFMKLINYPGTNHHIDLHFDLLEKFNIVKNNDTSPADFLKFIVEWFVNHTGNEDKQIAKFCTDNNIDVNFKYDIVDD